MKHTDIINIVSQQEQKFAHVYEDLLNLEASCDLIADSDPDELEENINLMINSLLKYKTSKFEMLSSSFESNLQQQAQLSNNSN
ncbi:MAG TPA: hypothetical protein DHV28_13345 [Ignavibacteriales bacterium]|nr:hypothetical protein [Ignavibacteriales bacterium]